MSPRHRPSPALVISIISLIVAMSGSAIAAGYVITSTKQLKPSVLKKLKGKRGAKGPIGLTGPIGVPGATGATGATGPAGSTGATGTAGTNGTNGSNGATGARGPSEAIIEEAGNVSDIAGIASPTPLAFYNLPPGKFLIGAKVNLDNDTTAAELVTCRILAGATPLDTATVNLSAKDTGGESTVVALAGQAQSIATQTLDFVCGDSGGTVSATQGRLWSTQVETLTLG